MPCENYREALIEAAAAGAAPSPELRSHVDACLSCRAAFHEELQLFAAIDAGLHVGANCEVPASLVPRVRASLGTQAVRKIGWFRNRLVLAGAAMVVLAVSVVLVVWRHGSGAAVQPTDSAVKPAAPSLPMAKDHTPMPSLRASTNPADHSRAAIAANRAPRQVQANGENVLEVLVPQDQEALLVSYAAEWGRRKRAPLIAENSSETTLTLLEFAPIQIAQLDVKLLTDEKLQ